VKALVFGEFPDPMPPQPPEDAPRLVKHLASTPMSLIDVDEPRLLGPDWAVIRPRMTGICGSDTKQVLMDFEGAEDSPMTAFISFPQVLGHEVVATVDQVGPELEGIEPGQRVVLNPWLSSGRVASLPCARRVKSATGACASTFTTVDSLPAFTRATHPMPPAGSRSSSPRISR
jgi:threonine dehydrogenase-like Zn-dependent dehydrogenase